MFVLFSFRVVINKIWEHHHILCAIIDGTFDSEPGIYLTTKE
jgi:hypothetical protein